MEEKNAGTKKSKKGACLLCGKPLRYTEKAQELTCVFCGKKFLAHASCQDGHYVCDQCHANKGIEHIISYCMNTTLNDPIEMVREMMEDPFIYMHGPEHHVMVGAALLTAYYHNGGELVLEEALQEMRARGSEYPGGACGFWGCCGAAVSAGMFMSIALKATPLTEKSWAMANEMTSRALLEISKLGGPRCCKRNSYTAICSAVQYVEEKTGIHIPLPQDIVCTHSGQNAQCLKQKCPYHPIRQKKGKG